MWAFNSCIFEQYHEINHLLARAHTQAHTHRTRAKLELTTGLRIQSKSLLYLERPSEKNAKKSERKTERKRKRGGGKRDRGLATMETTCWTAQLVGMLRNSGLVIVQHMSSGSNTSEVLQLQVSDAEKLRSDLEIQICCCCRRRPSWFTCAATLRINARWPTKRLGIHPYGNDEYLKQIFVSCNEWQLPSAVGYMRG